MGKKKNKVKPLPKGKYKAKVQRVYENLYGANVVELKLKKRKKS